MPEPTLQAAALRYAAGDLTAAETAAFEARLAHDQKARDALEEAVRLSAAALGQRPPAAHQSFRAAVREKLTGWNLPGFARRAYRGHPFAWAGLGAATVAACTVIGLTLADRTSAPVDEGLQAAVVLEPEPVAPDSAVALTNPQDCDPALLAACGGESTGNSVAEIWAHLSTPDQVEKLHDDEIRWRDKLRSLGIFPVGRSERRDQ